jgi:hypothetical protein
MATGSLISEQEYLSTTYKPNCEYIDGVLRQKPMATEAHSAIQAELAYLPTEVPAGGHLTADGISIPLADVFAAL